MQLPKSPLSHQNHIENHIKPYSLTSQTVSVVKNLDASDDLDGPLATQRIKGIIPPTSSAYETLGQRLTREASPQNRLTQRDTGSLRLYPLFVCRKTLELQSEEVVLRTQNCCCSSSQRRPYAQLTLLEAGRVHSGN